MALRRARGAAAGAHRGGRCPDRRGISRQPDQRGRGTAGERGAGRRYPPGLAAAAGRSSYFAHAAEAGLASARSTTLLSVVFNGEASQLTSVTAVTPGYPLRGHLLVAGEPFGRGTPAAGVPAAGEVWPDSRLLAAIGARVGSRAGHRRRHLPRHPGADLQARSGQHLRRACPKPDHECRGPAGHAADPARQPRELRRPVRRRSRQRSTPSRAGSSPTSAPASGCGISPRRVRRCATPWTAPAASSASRAW